MTEILPTKDALGFYHREFIPGDIIITEDGVALEVRSVDANGHITWKDKPPSNEEIERRRRLRSIR